MLSTADTFEEATAPSKSKKQKTTDTNSDKQPKKSKSADVGAIKSVKKVDPAIIEQRRDAVFQRVLKLESKLAKDRALLEKYSIPTYSTDTKDGSESDEVVSSEPLNDE
jgi:outer membrane phospholipase A